MRNLKLLVSLFGLGLVVATTTQAHHAVQAQFDVNKQETFTGTLVKVDWINPHIYFYLDVKDDAGKVTNWTLESIPTGFMHRAGLTRDDFVLGDNVTVLAYRAKDGTKAFGWVQEFTFPNGRKVAFGATRPAPETDESSSK